MARALKVQQSLETPTKLLRYPRCIAFMILNIFSNRLNAKVLMTILVLFLIRKIQCDEDTATVIFHLYLCLLNFSALFGAILSDSLYGSYKTLIILFVVTTIGTVMISIDAIPLLNLPLSLLTFFGLFLNAIGNGGAKPCLLVIGCEQFKLPEQARHLASFFSICYFASNIGSLVASGIAPILRADTSCFGDNDCFSLAFGAPAIVTLCTIFIFMSAKSSYILNKPTGNMLILVTKCIFNALTKKFKERKNSLKCEPKIHWLNYAEEKYGKQLISDIKVFLKIVIISLPLPLFWTLFDQQNSRWTFQATKMIGNIAGIYVIKPDQIVTLNPILTLVFILLFDFCIYSLLAKIGVRKSLEKVAIGGLLAALSFVLSGIVEMKLESLEPVLPSEGIAQLRIYNGFNCNYDFTTNISNHENFVLQHLSVFEEKNINVSNRLSFSYEAIPRNITDCPKMSGELELDSNKATSYFLNRNGLEKFEEKLSRSSKGLATVRVLTNSENKDDELKLIGMENEIVINGSNLYEFSNGHFALQHGNYSEEIELEEGGVYTFIIFNSGDLNLLKVHMVTQPNSLHMLWQLPQYITLTAGEVMYSINCMEFFYTEAPTSLKSVAQSLWIIANATGNLLVVLIVKFIHFKTQSIEFFTFAFLMFFDMGILIFLAVRYKYIVFSTSNKTAPSNDVIENNSTASSNIN